MEEIANSTVQQIRYKESAVHDRRFISIHPNRLEFCKLKSPLALPISQLVAQMVHCRHCPCRRMRDRGLSQRCGCLVWLVESVLMYLHRTKTIWLIDRVTKRSLVLRVREIM